MIIPFCVICILFHLPEHVNKICKDLVSLGETIFSVSWFDRGLGLKTGFISEFGAPKGRL